MPRIGNPVKTASESPLDPLRQRLARLSGLLRLLEPVPAEFAPRRSDSENGGAGASPSLSPLPCDNYDELLLAWRKAMRWRQELDDVLSIMLAVAVSTEQLGDQLFMMVIADPGSGKTQFCDAMLTNREHCHGLEHVTGFYSGWKDENGKECSLIDRINGKCLITPEGDVVMSSPHFHEVMSQARRIFDGKGKATYKNQDTDKEWEGLRTPWIMAGTPAMLDSDQSRLGDRFLKVLMNKPDEDEQDEILRRVAFTAARSVRIKADGVPESQMEEYKCLAYRQTGGYVQWLRTNVDLLSSVVCDEEQLEQCTVLAKFCAFMRARPGDAKKEEQHDTKELPTRLTHQFVRLAFCVAVVLNRKTIDAEVMRRVRKVALDTCSGYVLRGAHYMAANHTEGVEASVLSSHINFDSMKMNGSLRFLKRIGVADLFTPPAQTVIVNGKSTQLKLKQRWRLTEKVYYLYHRVFSDVQ